MDDYPGRCLSADQIVSGITGMIPQSSGKPVGSRFFGATVYVDNSTNFRYVHMMTSLDAKETLESKLAFESLMLSFGVKVKKYRVDNGRCNDPLYNKSC